MQIYIATASSNIKILSTFLDILRAGSGLSTLTHKEFYEGRGVNIGVGNYQTLILICEQNIVKFKCSARLMK